VAFIKLQQAWQAFFSIFLGARKACFVTPASGVNEAPWGWQAFFSIFFAFFCDPKRRGFNNGLTVGFASASL
jgi:hypothetical protein